MTVENKGLFAKTSCFAHGDGLRMDCHAYLKFVIKNQSLDEFEKEAEKICKKHKIFCPHTRLYVKIRKLVPGYKPPKKKPAGLWELLKEIFSI
jgi:hypothetical protein